MTTKLKFKVGKCYEFTTGKQIHICGRIDTVAYGRVLVAEEGWNVNRDTRMLSGDTPLPVMMTNRGWSLVPILPTTKTSGWKEIEYKDFLSNNVYNNMLIWKTSNNLWYLNEEAESYNKYWNYKVPE